MSDSIKCDKCGAFGSRPRMFPAPPGWFFIETTSESAPGESWFTYACTVACRDSLWQMGPGKRWKPEEFANPPLEGVHPNRRIQLVASEDAQILDDDSQFLVDVLSAYGNTQANDVVPSDGIDAARRLATGIKTGTLRLLFHDDLEDLAARILKLEGIEHVLVCVVRTLEDVEWSVALGGDGWEVCEQRRTLTEAVNNAIERGTDEGTSGVRNFIHRCKSLSLEMDASYLLALDAGTKINPDTWETLWKETST